MLTLTDPHGEVFAPFGTVVSTLTGRLARGGLGFDPITGWINGSLVECGVLPVSALIGSFRNNGEASSVHLSIEKPRLLGYTAQQDAGTWANALNSIPTALETFVHGSFPDFTTGREHRMSHLAYRGELGPSITWDPLYVNTGDYQSYIYESQTRFHDSTGYEQTPNLSPFDRVYFDGTSYPLVQKGGISSNDPPMATLRERRSQWRSYFAIPRRWNWFGYCPYVTIVYDYVDLSPEDSFSFHCSYKYVFATMDQGGFYDSIGQPRYEETHCVDLFVTINTDVPPATFSASSNSWYNIQDMGGITVKVVDNFCDSRDFGSGYPTYGPAFGCPTVGTVTELQWSFSGSVLVAHPDAGDGSGTTGSFSFEPLIRLSDPRTFQRNVGLVSGDILASAYISSTNALLGEPLISSNLIEAANEWQDVQAFLPDLSTGLELISQIKGGNLVRTGYELLKFVTGAELYKDFGLNPNIQAVTQIFSAAKKLDDLLRSPGSSQRFYGKFHFTFPEGEFGRVSSYLDTRTMIVVPTEGNSLGGLLNMQSLGIVPLPHMIWATLPFSFVVDWYLGIGARLKAMAYALLGSTLRNARLVHTFRVYTPLTDLELSSISARPKGFGTSINKPCMQALHRDVSRWFPSPRDSKYNFLLPTHLPPWQIAASLALQLVL